MVPNFWLVQFPGRKKEDTFYFIIYFIFSWNQPYVYFVSDILL